MLTEHLWLHEGAFPDWIAPYVDDLRVCEMYGCTPEQADELDYHRVKRHRAIREAEAQYRREDAKANAAFERVRYRGR